MRLGELSKRLQGSMLVRDGGENPDVALLVYDSRLLKGLDSRNGDAIFACVRGEHTDGHKYATDAVAAGCVALLCEERLPLGVPQIVTPNVRAAMSLAAALIYGCPAEAMTMVGVTGTNGKTTTAYIVRSIMRAAGRRAGMLGTIVYDDGVSETEADRTTPEGPDVQRYMQRMRANGVDCCVMEASSHGLHQGRLLGCLFDGVGFSNLTPEHLEYHSDMEAYYQAKRLLFTDYVKPGWGGAVNCDDEYGRRLLAEIGGGLRGFTLHSGEGKNAPDLYTSFPTQMDLTGISLDIRYPDGERMSLRSPLIGRHNAYNILEAATVADALGVSREVVRKGIANCPQIPGRLERIAFENGVSVFVDFAHSSDSMKKVLSMLSAFPHEKLRVLWGAGGDRDRTKRPVVGGLMAKIADEVIVTSDNPRSEDPMAIAKDVEAGLIAENAGVPHEIVVDRKEAIFRALDHAGAGDVVLVAGKGPESYIDFGTHKVPFSDVGTVLEWGAERSVGVRR